MVILTKEATKMCHSLIQSITPSNNLLPLLILEDEFSI